MRGVMGAKWWKKRIFEADAFGWPNWELGTAWLIWDAHEVIGLEVLFAVPAIADEGVVSTSRAEVEAGDVGSQGCAGVVRRQPIVTAEHWGLIGSVAGHATDFVVLSFAGHVERFRKGEMAYVSPFGEVPPAHPNGMALYAFFVVKQVSVRHLHFGAFEDVFHGAMLGAQSACAGVEEGGIGKALTNETGNSLQIPAGVDGAKVSEIEEEGEVLHPFQPFGPFVHVMRELIE